MTLATIRLGPPDAAREVILLPPVRARPADALAAGFDTALDHLDSPPRVTLVDLALEDLAGRDGVAALWPQIVAPALASGRRVWLAGISLGAWLAVLTTRRAETALSSRLAGLALIAPWLGTRAIHREIEAAGGVIAWAHAAPAPTTAPPPGSLDEEREGWRFVAATTLPVWLGYGAADRFAAAQSLLAAALPETRVRREGGGHDWPCWGRIWEHLLAWLPC